MFEHVPYEAIKIQKPIFFLLLMGPIGVRVPFQLKLTEFKWCERLNIRPRPQS